MRSVRERMSVQQCAPCVASTLITTRRKNDTLLCFHHNQFIYNIYSILHTPSIHTFICYAYVYDDLSVVLIQYVCATISKNQYALRKQLISIPNKNKTQTDRELIFIWLKYRRSNTFNQIPTQQQMISFDLFCFIIKIVIATVCVCMCWLSFNNTARQG